VHARVIHSIAQFIIIHVSHAKTIQEAKFFAAVMQSDCKSAMEADAFNVQRVKEAQKPRDDRFQGRLLLLRLLRRVGVRGWKGREEVGCQSECINQCVLLHLHCPVCAQKKSVQNAHSGTGKCCYLDTPNPYQRRN
jgi:hypothetical protein